MADPEIIKSTIAKAYPSAVLEEFREQLSVRIEKEQVTEFMTFLKNDPALHFNYITDITGVDFLKMEREPRFEVVYLIYSFDHNCRVRVKVGVDEEDMDIATVTPIWSGAHWLEREAFEMFGFNFVGHPDLRRLLLPDIFDGHPLRKDYPLRGRGERDVILDLK